MTARAGPVSDAEAIENARCRLCGARKGKPCVYIMPPCPSWIPEEEFYARTATNADLRAKVERADTPMKGVHAERRESARNSRWSRWYRDPARKYGALDEPLTVGDTLHGFCGGAFGRESYGDKIVEALGKDWVVARETDTDQAQFYEGDPGQLEEYRR